MSLEVANLLPMQKLKMSGSRLGEVVGTETSVTGLPPGFLNRFIKMVKS